MDQRRSTQMADATAVFASWVGSLSECVHRRNGSGFADLFIEGEAYWKDILAASWDFRTFAGRSAIREAFDDQVNGAGFRGVRVSSGRTPPTHIRRSGRSLIEGYFEFETNVGVGEGFVRLIYDPKRPMEAKAWQVLTALHHLHGFEEKVGARRPTGEKFSKLASAESWAQKRERDAAYAERDPEVVIVGAGQGGLMLAARLKQMDTDVLVLERTPRVGDVWRNRYNNLTLHNELTANHFPYMRFPENWPVWLPKDMLADWLEAYARFQELNVWTGTELTDTRFDRDTATWTLSVRRADGSLRTLRPKHLVAAMGVSGGEPKRPRMVGLEDFAGTVVHSREFTSGKDWAGKNALVVGTGNSGHDIAQDLHVAGATAVTMMQRGPTCVVSLDPSAMISYSVYNEGRPIEDVDLMVAAIPYPVLIDTYQWITRKTGKQDEALLRGLNEAGFKTYDGEDATGFQLLYLRGAGGYYIDVGCSRLIIERKVGLVQAEDTDRFVREGLRLKDGKVVPLDLVVLATGFEGMHAGIRRVFGGAVADRVGPIWGFDEDRNLRNVWKRTAHENFWVMGGAIIEARTFSRYLALQIKASLEGLMPSTVARPRQAQDVRGELSPAHA